jgi:hypothetical protein
MCTRPPLAWLFILNLVVNASRLFPQFRPLRLTEFIADTVVISSIADSLMPIEPATQFINDNRNLPPTILGIHQTEKLKFLPVDQYLALSTPLANQLAQVMHYYNSYVAGILVVDYLSLWHDGKPAFGSGYRLNAYTRLLDSTGKTFRDWQWELHHRPSRKQTAPECYSILYNQWLSEQAIAVKLNPVTAAPISPYRYRRQLTTWLDWIKLADGYILVAHLTLDYPADQLPKFIRGSPGIYYRRSSKHESIAIGGKDQQWYRRLNSHWLTRAYFTYRVGFNNFNPHAFDQVDFWNIVLLNLSCGVSCEYRPIYHRGLFVGAGLHQSVNLLPTVIRQFDTGILFTVGVVLP